MASIVRRTVTATLVAGLVLALLFLALGSAWYYQDRIAFQPPRGPWPDAPGVHRVDYSASDGQRLFAYIAGDTHPRELLLAFHGNADLAAWQVDWAEEIVRRTGVSVMLAEYRGYMGLEGRPSHEATRLDAEAAYLFARDELRVPPDRIAFFGHSLGSAVATELALKHQPMALLLQSPFTSARDMAGRMIGYSPPTAIWGMVSRLHFDTGAQVAQLDAPVSVAHGGGDRLVPLHMGQAIFAAAKRKGKWLVVPSASHNDVAVRGGEDYWNWITEALKE